MPDITAKGKLVFAKFDELGFCHRVVAEIEHPLLEDLFYLGEKATWNLARCRLAATVLKVTFSGVFWVAWLQKLPLDRGGGFQLVDNVGAIIGFDLIERYVIYRYFGNAVMRQQVGYILSCQNKRP